MAMDPYVALRGPTYRENSHATHTWYPPSQQSAYFLAQKAPPAMPGQAGRRNWGQHIDPVGKRWERRRIRRRFCVLT
jgi:hypothetical protein